MPRIQFTCIRRCSNFNYKMRKMFSIYATPVLMACLLPLQALSNTNQRPATISYSQQTLLKNWALSICFAQISSDTDLVKDANAAAGAYFELGRQDLDAYSSIRMLVKNSIKRESRSKPDIEQPSIEMNVMKCIDLFHSDELDKLTKRLTKRTTSKPVAK